MHCDYCHRKLIHATHYWLHQILTNNSNTATTALLSGLPLAEIIVLCGFFMIYIVEEVVHMMLSCARKVR